MAEDCPLPDCDGVLYYDTCEECGHRVDHSASQRTNIHLPSRKEVRRQKDKLAR